MLEGVSYVVLLNFYSIYQEDIRKRWAMGIALRDVHSRARALRCMQSHAWGLPTTGKGQLDISWQSNS